jgi:membrane associated rhomboid family serine protease
MAQIGASVNERLTAISMKDSKRDMSSFSAEGGGREGVEPIFNAPAVVVYLIGVLLLIHAAIGVLPRRAEAYVEYFGAVSPRAFLSGFAAHGGFLRIFPPLVTHIFLHASWTHVLMNSVWLLVFGAPVARKLGADRRITDKPALVFLLFFLLSGVAGAMMFIAVHPAANTLLVGASGGVSGLFGGLTRFAFRRPKVSGCPEREFAKLTDRTVIIWSVLFLVLNIFVFFFGGLIAPGPGAIAWEAHMGGYLFGLLTFPAFVAATRKD